MINISASDLIKKSSKAICYFRKKQKQRTVTERQVNGNINALNKSTSTLLEMRGCYSFDNINIYFTFDEVIPNKSNYTLIEHKYVENASIIEDWYRNYSILQVAFYKTLFQYSPKKLITANFFINEGNPVNEIIIDKPYENILLFGNESYKIDVITPKTIIDFYKKKSVSTIEYEQAIEWDLQWKFREYDFLKNSIKIKKIKHL
jgi:hypothetical protein